MKNAYFLLFAFLSRCHPFDLKEISPPKWNHKFGPILQSKTMQRTAATDGTSSRRLDSYISTVQALGLIYTIALQFLGLLFQEMI